jgi:hypothetical protein
VDKPLLGGSILEWCFPHVLIKTAHSKLGGTAGPLCWYFLHGLLLSRPSFLSLTDTDDGGHTNHTATAHARGYILWREPTQIPTLVRTLRTAYLVWDIIDQVFSVGCKS